MTKVATPFRASSLFRHSSFELRHSSNAHPVTVDKFLREIIYPERDGEKYQAHHEKRAVMRTPAHHLPHFLRDDSGHRVDRLKDRAQALGEIWNRDPVSGAEQDDHGFADDASQPKKYRRDDAGQRSRYEHTADRLEPVCAERVGRFLESARDVAQGVFGEG